MAGPKGTIARGALEALTDAYKKTFDPETYYHTTPMGELEGGKFDPNFSLEDDGGLGATYFTKDKEYGSEAADFWRDVDPDLDWSEIAIYPVNIKTKNLFDFENKEHRKILSEKLTLDSTPGLTREDQINWMESGSPYFFEKPKVQKILKDLGFRGYHVDEPGSVGLFYPHKGDVRSIFAKFDPKEPKSGNILASVPAAALATGALSQLGDE